jgi:hypothetical protein
MIYFTTRNRVQRKKVFSISFELSDESLLIYVGHWQQGCHHPLVVTSESLVLFCYVLIVNLILIYWLYYVCRSWADYSFDGISRQRLINQVLDNLIHLHHPGVVTLLKNGRRVLTTSWDHYWFALDGDYGTAQGAVSHDFWVSIFSMRDFFFITLVY